MHVAANAQALCEAIVQQAQQCLAMGYRSVGLLCKSQHRADALYAQLCAHLPVRHIAADGEEELQGVCLLPIYLSKGLEFDAVILCDADAQTYCSEDDRRLLYIACTRALHRLSLLCAGGGEPVAAVVNGKAMAHRGATCGCAPVFVCGCRVGPPWRTDCAAAAPLHKNRAPARAGAPVTGTARSVSAPGSPCDCFIRKKIVVCHQLVQHPLRPDFDDAVGNGLHELVVVRGKQHIAL